MRLPLKLLAILSGLVGAILAGVASSGPDLRHGEWLRVAAFAVMIVAALASAPGPKGGGGDDEETL